MQVFKALPLTIAIMVLFIVPAEAVNLAKLLEGILPTEPKTQASKCSKNEPGGKYNCKHKDNRPKFGFCVIRILGIKINFKSACTAIYKLTIEPPMCCFYQKRYDLSVCNDKLQTNSDMSDSEKDDIRFDRKICTADTGCCVLRTFLPLYQACSYTIEAAFKVAMALELVAGGLTSSLDVKIDNQEGDHSNMIKPWVKQLKRSIFFF
ncbi:MAG: hypothetical protein CMF46_05460 [Legionellales bacterium]|nr:hypothetical protein [Legionellales bacterium]|tara:strand:+ start:694 stop:1314 length:621 start_codon:yes stop_codon:yes gene_type:complete